METNKLFPAEPVFCRRGRKVNWGGIIKNWFFRNKEVEPLQTLLNQTVILTQRRGGAERIIKTFKTCF
jgi:hypothetical protein